MPTITVEIAGLAAPQTVTLNLVPALVPTPTPTPVAVWIDKTALLSRPTSGAAWDAVLSIAKSATADGADVNNQDSTHSRSILATALAGVRLNDAALITKAKAGLADAIGTETPGRWLAVGRNLGAYIIAASVLEISSGTVYDWLKKFHNGTTKVQHDNDSSLLITLKESAWASGSNASAQEGFVYTALCAFFQDKTGLDYNFNCFRRYLGDRTSTWKMTSNDDDWQTIPTDPVGIQNMGAIKNGINIDGAVSNDMSRSNPVPIKPLIYKTESLYPWVGLDGAMMAAVVFYRQGYPVFDVQNQALLRAVKYLKRVADEGAEQGWWGQDKKEDAKWIAHINYGLSLTTYPITQPVANHDLVGYVDFTFPTSL